MSTIDLLNSWPLYLTCGIIILFVMAMSVFFMLRAWKAGTANLRFIPHQKDKESVDVLTTLAAKYKLETNCLPGAVDYYKNIIKMQEEF